MVIKTRSVEFKRSLIKNKKKTQKSLTSKKKNQVEGETKDHGKKDI